MGGAVAAAGGVEVEAEIGAEEGAEEGAEIGAEIGGGATPSKQKRKVERGGKGKVREILRGNKYKRYRGGRGGEGGSTFKVSTRGVACPSAVFPSTAWLIRLAIP